MARKKPNSVVVKIAKVRKTVESWIFASELIEHLNSKSLFIQ